MIFWKENIGTISQVYSLSSLLIPRPTSQLCLQQGILSRVGQGPQKIFKFLNSLATES